MKDWKFYEELSKKDRTKGHPGDVSKGTVLAVSTRPVRHDPVQHEWFYDGVGSIFAGDHPNGPVASTEVAWGYIEKHCRRITEKRAREIHPRLFAYLSDEGDPQGDRL